MLPLVLGCHHRGPVVFNCEIIWLRSVFLIRTQSSWRLFLDIVFPTTQPRPAHTGCSTNTGWTNELRVGRQLTAGAIKGKSISDVLFYSADNSCSESFSRSGNEIRCFTNYNMLNRSLLLRRYDESPSIWSSISQYLEHFQNCPHLKLERG